MTDDIIITVLKNIGFFGAFFVLTYLGIRNWMELHRLREAFNATALETEDDLDRLERRFVRDLSHAIKSSPQEIALAARTVTARVREIEHRVAEMSVRLNYLAKTMESHERDIARGSTLTPAEMIDLVHAFNPPIPDPVREPDAYIDEGTYPEDPTDGIYDPAAEALAGGNWIMPEQGATEAHLPIDDPFPVIGTLHPDEARAAAEMAQHEDDMQVLADGALGFPTGLDG